MLLLEINFILSSVRTQRAMKSFIPSSIKLLNHWETCHNPDSFYHHLHKYCSIVLFSYSASLFNFFFIISSFDCTYFITTVFYGQPFYCLILLCMWSCLYRAPSLCITHFHVFMDEIKLYYIILSYKSVVSRDWLQVRGSQNVANILSI